MTWSDRPECGENRAADSVDGKGSQAGRPEAASDAAVPGQREEHGKGQRTEAIAADGLAPMPFRQGEQSVGEAAKGTGAARQPAESTEPEPRFGRREVPQDGQQKGRPGGADEDAARRQQRVSAVRGSKPTISL